MRMTLLALPLCLIPLCALAQDADNDGLSDALEAKLGMDPHHADTFELLHDDKAKADGDKSIGKEIEFAGDFTRIWSCPVARGRHVWKIEFTKPWAERTGVATILYVDADNDRATGRRDKEFARGVDMMLRPKGVSMFEWPALVRTTSASEGNTLYLAADIKLNQQDGKSVYRITMLTQDTREGRRRDTDNMSFVTVSAGRSDRSRIRVPASHPLYHPPEIISDIAVRMVPDAPDPTAEVTWITSWPCDSRVEFGQTEDLGQSVEAEPGMQNHRAFLPVQEGKQYHFRVTCISEEGEPKPSAIMRFRSDLPAPVGSVERGEVPLALSGRGGDASAAPFLAGVPFPRGALGGVAHLRVLRNGSELPIQADCAARWPDGTVRWALVQFLADCPEKSEGAVTLEYGNAIRPSPTSAAPMVKDEGDLLICNTGPLEAVIDKRSFNLFHSLSLDKNGDGVFDEDEQLIGDPTRAGLYLVDAAGKEYVSRETEEVVIEENGPVRAVVEVRGHHTAEDGSQLFEYIVRLMFYRGHSHVRIFHTFGNDNVGQKTTDIAAMGIRIPVAVSGDGDWGVVGEFDELHGRRVRLPQDPGVLTSLYGGVYVRGEGARWALRQTHHNRFTLSARDSRQSVDTTGRKAGDVYLYDGLLGAHVHLPDLREQYPKGWAVADNTLDIQLCPKLNGDEYANADPVTSDRLYYYLRDGVYRFHRGVSKTHEIHLGLASGEDRGPDFFSLQFQMMGTSWLASPSPEWIAKTQAAGLMTPRVEGEFDEYEGFVERSFEAFQKRREKLGEYGMLNFGDWWGERGYNWGNVEYDTQHVMLMEYLRTGDRKFLKRGCEAAIHNRDVDGVHYSQNPRSVGTVIVHCMFHTGGYEVRTPDRGLAFPTGSFNRGHVWTRGLFDHYFLTGDRRSKEWALAIADYLAGPMTVGFSVGNHAERDTAWPIFGVMAAYEATADPYYLNAARLMIEDVIRRQIPETGNWGFPAGYSEVEPKPIGGYAWCCGLLISSLDLYNGYAHDPRVDEVIVRAARWLVRDEWVKEKQGFRATSCPSFNKGTPPGGSCWSCGNAMLIAHKLTGEEQFLDIARRGFSLFIRGTRSVGKGVTQSICLGPETLWRFKQADITSLDPTPYLSPGQASIPGHLVLLPGGKAVLPVIIRSSRKERQQAEVRVMTPPELRAEPASLTVELTAGGQEVRLPFEILGAEALLPGASKEVTVTWKLGEVGGTQTVKLIRPKPIAMGEKLGLIASGDDFLGSALDKLGLEYERLGSLDEIGDCRALLLGTQAHSINSVGLKDRYWELFSWVHDGGRLFLSQLNDTGWERWFLPYEVVVDELDGESGAIAAPAHPIFSAPNKVTAAEGVKMYDTLRLMPEDPWTVLLRDAAGGPAIVEAPFGKGKLLIMQPSFERLMTPEGTAQTERSSRLFENVIKYATR